MKMTSSGRASAPIFRYKLPELRPQAMGELLPLAGVTNAAIACPSARAPATTAASATDGCSTRADSTSIVPIR